MSKAQFISAFLLPAAYLFIAALWFGSQPHFIFALTGFLGCFVIAVTLLVEGWKKFKKLNSKKVP